MPIYGSTSSLVNNFFIPVQLIMKTSCAERSHTRISLSFFKEHLVSKYLSPKQNFVHKISGQKKVQVQQILGLNKFGSDKILALTKCWV